MFIPNMLLLIGVALRCGISGLSQAPAEIWEDTAVIYAEVLGVQSGAGHGFIIELKPLATLSGRVDAAFEGKLFATVVIGDSQIREISAPPKKGAKVIAVVIQNNSKWHNAGIPNGSASFLPLTGLNTAPCLFEVTGFDDPKVTETIEKLQKLRGKQREEAEKAAAEKAQSGKNPITPPTTAAAGK